MIISGALLLRFVPCEVCFSKASRCTTTRVNSIPSADQHDLKIFSLVWCYIYGQEHGGKPTKLNHVLNRDA